MSTAIELVRFAEFYERSNVWATIEDFEDMLRDNELYSGAESLEDRLLRDGYLKKDEDGEIVPVDYYFFDNIFSLKTERTIRGHVTEERREAVITGKGQVYFVNRFLAERGIQ